MDPAKSRRMFRFRLGWNRSPEPNLIGGAAKIIGGRIEWKKKSKKKEKIGEEKSNGKSNRKWRRRGIGGSVVNRTERFDPGGGRRVEFVNEDRCG